MPIDPKDLQRRQYEPCEVPGCPHLCDRLSRYCQRHHLADCRHGDPLGKPLSTAKGRRWAEAARRVIARNADKPPVVKALAWIGESLLPLGRPVAHVGWREPWQASLRFLHALKTQPVQPLDVLATIVGVIALSQAGTGDLIPGRHLKHQLVFAVAKLAPTARRASRSKELRDFCPPTMRDQMGELLLKHLGSLALRMAPLVAEEYRSGSAPPVEVAAPAPLPETPLS